MRLFKRGKFYWFEFVFEGQRIQKSTKQTNQNEAKKAAAAYFSDLAKGKFGLEEKKPAPTLREFSTDFMKQIRMDCASKPRTVDFYEEKLGRVLAYPKIADVPLDQIDEELIEAYKRSRSATVSRRKRPVSPASINRELATLRRLLRMAKSWKRIPSVPEIKLLRGETAREFVLSRDDEQRYLDALPAAMRDFCTVLIETGLRVGEGLTLEWPQVNLREQPGYLRVRAVLAKSSKTRTVPLTSRVRAIFEARKDRKGLVFRNADDAPLYHTWLDQQHADVRTRLGFPAEFVLHSLRHTFGTRLGETGADVRTIMELMGHATMAVAQKYVHPSTEATRLAMERMSQASGVPTKVPTGLKVVKSKKRVSGL